MLLKSIFIMPILYIVAAISSLKDPKIKIKINGYASTGIHMKYAQIMKGVSMEVKVTLYA